MPNKESFVTTALLTLAWAAREQAFCHDEECTLDPQKAADFRFHRLYARYWKNRCLGAAIIAAGGKA